MICVGNFSAVPRSQYRLALPEAGEYEVLINSAAEVYSGSGEVAVGTLLAEEVSHHGRAHSASVDLPALSTIWFEIPNAK